MLLISVAEIPFFKMATNSTIASALQRRVFGEDANVLASTVPNTNVRILIQI